MQLFSSSPTKPKYTLHTLSENSIPKSNFKITTIRRTIHSSSSPLTVPLCYSSATSPIVQEKIQLAVPPPPLSEKVDNGDQEEDNGGETSDDVLVVRRPVMEVSSEESEETNVAKETSSEYEKLSTSPIDSSLLKFAKKMPIFEPGRAELGPEQKPLRVNLDLSLYRAKVLGRNCRYREAERILNKCIYYWPEDGRLYVALGKILSKQGKTADARIVYEKGCQATQGENAYIWQCWAVLENKLGNIRRARELFDAATVADKSHVAAWHGWAVLEMKQGNSKKARILLGKGLKNCGGNEYIYQTLALLEAKVNRYEQARFLFRKATTCNPKSCASWLAWAQLEMQQENVSAAIQLFEKAVQASPKNRFAWNEWGLFEAGIGNVEKARKLLKVGHILNPRDPVLLQSLALLEYRYSTANLSRALFRRASEIDPRHQPIWMAWGWMEWKEGNIATARQLYQRSLTINSSSETAARCLQAWGVLEQRIGNLSAARRLFRSSLNVNSQSYVTWMTWASLEEDQGNSVRAEEIRNLYFQQRTEVVDDGSWTMGFLDNFVDPALDGLKRLLSFNQKAAVQGNGNNEESAGSSADKIDGSRMRTGSSFDLNAFISENLSLDPSKLDDFMDSRNKLGPKKIKHPRSIWRSTRTARVDS